MRAFLTALIACLLAATSHGADMDFDDDFTSGTLNAKWNNIEGLAKDGDTLVLDAAEDRAVGSAYIKDSELGGHNRVEFKAIGVDLSAGEHHMRSVTLRVDRGGQIIYGTVFAYKDDRGGALKVMLRLGLASSQKTPKSKELTIPTLTGILTLEIDGTDANLSFDTASCPPLDNLTDSSIDDCRVELATDRTMQASPGNPSVDQVTAKSDF